MLFHNYPPMTIGERIREARERLKMSRPELAKAADIPYPTLAGIENSDQASSTRLHALAKALKVRAEWLETGKGPLEATVGSQSEEGWADIIGARQATALGDGTIVGDYAETQKLKFRAESLRRKHLDPAKLAVFRTEDDKSLLFDTSDVEPRDEKLYVVSFGGKLSAKRLLDLGGRWFVTSDRLSDPKWKKPVAVDDLSDFAIHGRVRWIGSWED